MSPSNIRFFFITVNGEEDEIYRRYIKNKRERYSIIGNIYIRYTLIEFYVIFWLFFFVISLCFCNWWSTHFIYLIIGGRLADILSANLGIIFIDRYKNGGIRSINRSLLLIGINYFEIIVLFAIMYLASQSIGYSSCSNIITNPTEAFFYSMSIITTLGCSDMRPVSLIGTKLVGLESILGVILIVIVIGAFFTFYSKR